LSDLLKQNHYVKVLNYSFICQVPQPGDSEGTISVFESSCHCYYQSNHTKVEAIQLSALPKDTASKLAGLTPH